MNSRKEQPKKILAIASMTGSAEALGPAIKRLQEQGHKVHIVSYAGATSKFKEFSLEPHRVLKDSYEATRIGVLRKQFETFEPDVVLAGTGYQYKDHVIVADQIAYRLGKEMNIPVVAVLDAYGGYLERFSRLGGSRYDIEAPMAHLPDAIIVMDDFARDAMLKQGFDPNIVHTLGNPYYEYVMLQVRLFGQETIDRMFSMPVFAGFDKHVPVLLYLSDEIDERYANIGYNETTALQSFLKSVGIIAESRNGINVIVRPHPFRQGVARDVAEATEVPEDLKMVVHHPVSDENQANQYSIEEVIYFVGATGGAVIGTFNSPMVTAACMRGDDQLPVISHQPNLNPDHPNMQAYTDDREITTPTREDLELIGAIALSLDRELIQKPMEFVNGAIDRVVEFVVSLADKPR